mmetsp:Transcript_5439/g.15259  ORF Transcript_5439/g.15259 Transcript_5439/m.15259 type:complete len:210 (-) Transcript_5439:2028-2657(-)
MVPLTKASSLASTRSAPRLAPRAEKRRVSSVRRCRCSGARSADIRGVATPATPPRRPSAARLFYKYLVVITSSAPGRHHHHLPDHSVSFDRSGSRRWSSATRSDPGASSCRGKDQPITDKPPRRRPRFRTRGPVVIKRRGPRIANAAASIPLPIVGFQRPPPKLRYRCATGRRAPAPKPAVSSTSCPGTQRPTLTARWWPLKLSRRPLS